MKDKLLYNMIMSTVRKNFLVNKVNKKSLIFPFSIFMKIE